MHVGFDFPLRNYLFLFLFVALLVFLKMNRYSVAKLQDKKIIFNIIIIIIIIIIYQENQKGKAQKLECTRAVDIYVTKSKLQIELNILHTNSSETN